MSDRSRQRGFVPVALMACLGLSTGAFAQEPPATATWADQFFGDPTYDYAYGVARSATQVHVTAQSSGTAYLRVYSLDGPLLWQQDFAAVVLSQAVAADDSQVCVGGSQSTFGFVECLDPDGAVLWSDQIRSDGPHHAQVKVDALAVSPDAVYAVGWTTGKVLGCTPACESGGKVDAFIRKYSFDGTTVSPEWTRQYGGPNDDYGRGLSVAADGLGLVRVWGFESRPATTPPPYREYALRLSCYQADGMECGTDRLSFGPGAPSAGDFAGDAFYAAYHIGGLVWTVVVEKYTLSGNVSVASVEWGDSFLAAGSWSLVADASGAVLAGEAHSPLPGQQGAGFIDAFVRRYDAAGTEAWTLQYGSTSSDHGNGLALDADSLYLVGSTSGNLDGVSQISGPDGFVARIERPDSPQSVVGGLIEQIEELVDEDTLNRGQGNSLLTKLEQALSALEAGDTARATRRLEAFINQIQAFKNAGILEVAVADEIIAAAQGVLDAIAP